MASEVIVVNRGGYNINTYKIIVSEDMRKLAIDFAVEIITKDNQYSRLLPKEVRESGDLEIQKKVEIQRTYVGKLGELVFSKFLEENNISHDTDGMLEIFEGQENVDNFDFITSDHETIDIKTGFRPIHRLLLVNLEQFNNIPKKYYVAIKLDAKEITDENNVNKLVEWESITCGIVEGYADYNFLNLKAQETDRGEGMAKECPYNRLMGIDKLLKKM